MKVIIAEDDATTRLVLSSLIKKMGHEPIAVADGVAAWNAYLQQEEPCLMLIDWEMPELDGLDLCIRIKERAKLEPPYMILVTSRVDVEDVVRGLELGADDYVRKPFNASELAARITVAQRTLELNRKLTETQTALKFQATHDSLTGLLNRGAMLEALGTEISRAQRLGLNLHLAMCDIDDFKKINDTYGHIKGDEILQAISATMERVFRNYDLVGRYGGEEFLIAMADSKQSAPEMFERLRAEIEALSFDTDMASGPHAGKRIHPTISIGLCSMTGEDLMTRDLDTMLKQADDRLYIAKSRGKNQVVLDD